MLSSIPKTQAAECSVGVPSYPVRRTDWLHQFSSLLARADVAREIGRDAVLLLLRVAVQEDRQQYLAAPIFFYSELQLMTGIRCVSRLKRIIQIAAEAGWLRVVYSDEENSVGQYWTLIPQRLKIFESVPQIPIDSRTAHCQATEPKPLNAQQVDFQQVNRQTVGPETSDRPAAAVPQRLVQPGDEPNGALPQCNVAFKTAQQTASAAESSDHPLPIEATAYQQAPVTIPVGAASGQTASSVDDPAADFESREVHNPASNSSAATTHSAPVTTNAPATPNALATSAPSNRILEANDLWKIYPKRGIYDQSLPAILHALEVVPYAVLQPLVQKLAVQVRMQNRHPAAVPSVATWFHDQRARYEMAK